MSFSRSWWCALVLAASVVGCHHDTDRGTSAPSAPNAYAEPHTQPYPAEPQAEGAATEDNNDQLMAPDTVGSAQQTPQGSGSGITSQREPTMGSGSGSGSAQRDRDPDPDNDMNDLD